MNNDNINDIANRIKAALARECKIMGGSFKIDTKLVITPVELSKNMLDKLETSCKTHGFSYMRMPSGAGHDSLEIGQQLPAVMVLCLVRMEEVTRQLNSADIATLLKLRY